jgi:hypothetical protein
MNINEELAKNDKRNKNNNINNNNEIFKYGMNWTKLIYTNRLSLLMIIIYLS